jgi:Cu2+-containing amine oxidase
MIFVYSKNFEHLPICWVQYFQHEYRRVCQEILLCIDVTAGFELDITGLITFHWLSEKEPKNDYGNSITPFIRAYCLSPAGA